MKNPKRFNFKMHNSKPNMLMLSGTRKAPQITATSILDFVPFVSGQNLSNCRGLRIISCFHRTYVSQLACARALRHCDAELHLPADETASLASVSSTFLVAVCTFDAAASTS